MTQILVRNLDPATAERLKEKARQHNRSLQAEAKAILERDAAFYTMAEARAVSLRWHKRTAGSKQSDSVKLVREDRRR